MRSLLFVLMAGLFSSPLLAAKAYQLDLAPLQAEAELTKANVFVPFGAPIRWSLVRGEAAGFAVNRWNIHPLMPMAMRPK